MDTSSRRSPLALVVTLVIVTAIIGSLVSMFTVGHRQRSVILMTMFFVWVLSPFVALWLVNSRAQGWTSSARRQLEYATILISLAALARYVSVLLWPVMRQPASTFLIVPFVSWVAIAIIVGIARRQARFT